MYFKTVNVLTDFVAGKVDKKSALNEISSRNFSACLEKMSYD